MLESNRQLRILQVAPFPPPWSGIGVAVQNLLGSQAISAQATWVLSSSPGRRSRQRGRTKWPTLYRVSRHVELAGRVAALVRHDHIDVVHLHGSSHDLSFVANWLSVVAARAAGARVVWHLHQDLAEVEFPGRSRFTRGVFRLAMRAPSVLAVLTEKDRRIAAPLVGDGKIEVLPPSCSPELLDVPVPRAAHAAVRVLYVGWLSRAKGIHDLMQVALAVRDRVPQLKIDVLGTDRGGSDGDDAREFIKTHALQSHVELCGVVTGAAKYQRFADADILVMPTYRDAFPLAVLEAMAAGLPVVATNVGGIPFMIEVGRGGYLVQPGDVAGLAQRLVDLASDPAARAAMGRANRQRFLEMYHPDRAGEEAVRVYRQLRDSAS